MAKKRRKKKLSLPKNYREQVVETLLKQGVTLNVSQVYDIRRGRYKDQILTKKVVDVITKLSKEHCARKTNIGSLVAAVN